MKQYKILFTSRYAIDSYTQPIVDNVRTHCDVNCGVNFFWESDDFYDVIHFQWPEELFGWSLFSQEDLVRLEDRINYWLSIGAKLVITRHNEMPHRKFELDAALYSLFEKYCHGQVHMGLFSLNNLSFKNAKNVFIEHPNNIHLDLDLNKDLIRKKYRILPNEIVYLLFGKLRDKEDEDLIVKNFSKARKSNELLYVSHSNYVKRNKSDFFDKLIYRFKNVFSRKKGILLKNALYNNVELNELMAIADIVVISRSNNLNSGILYLSYSFKKLIMAPSIGNLTEKLFENASFVPNDDDSIVKAFTKARTLLKTDCNLINYNYVNNECDPVKIGKEYFNFYSAIINGK